MEQDLVLTLADGRVFTGRQAAEVGLVDQLGDLRAAANMAADLAGLAPEPTLVRKSRTRIPLLEILDQMFREGARATWGPRVEYRLR